MDERQSIPYALNHCSVRCTMRLPPFHTLGIGPSSLGHNAVPGNASPGHRTWHPAPCCRADRVRRAGPQTHVSQLDLHPIMTSAPGSPAGDPRASILTLAAYLPGSRHVHTQAHVHAHTHEHVRMHTPVPGTTSKKHLSDTSSTYRCKLGNPL